MKRLSYEFVKRQFEKERYELLSKEYVNAHTKLEYKCSNGHKHSISYAKWYTGGRCRYCSNRPVVDIDFVKKSFKKENYVILSEKYESAQKKLGYICSKGHRYYMTWNNWQQGKRCFYCAIGIRASKNRLDFNTIKEEFENEGYKLLTTIYKNCDQKLKYICPHNHEHSISWNDWKYNNSRCAVCADIRNSGPGNCNWKGGISCEPYCDAWADKEYKLDIMDRDNNECQNPNCWRTNKQLCLHHIDYNKKECGPTNLITLCKSCNSRVNKDRESYKNFYSNIIKKKYNYKEV